MNAHTVIIAPSILSANFGCLQDEVDSVEGHADWLQIDVMDGHFVPNLSFGAPVMKWLKTGLLLDVHLMVSNPSERVNEFLDAGAKHITFHAEAVKSTAERTALIEKIRSGGATAGIALNPETNLEEVVDVLSEIDVLLIMSVKPGFGGQSFISDVLEKVRQARNIRPNLMIQMDGGIDDGTIGGCALAGANNFVSGSFIFRSSDRAGAIRTLRKACEM